MRQLEGRIREAMQQTAEDAGVAFVELHDALTTLKFHGKPLPGRFDDQLLIDIEKVCRHSTGYILNASPKKGYVSYIRDCQH